MTIRKTTMDELARIEEIYAYAREQMKKNGNPHQWGDSKPGWERLMADIEQGISHVMEDERGVFAVFVFFVGEEPSYRVIEGGAWKNDLPYGVIHRVASDGTHRGVVTQIAAYCSAIIPNLRIDTHRDNRIMQRALERNGFERCGVVYVEDGSERLAYQHIGASDLPHKR